MQFKKNYSEKVDMINICQIFEIWHILSKVYLTSINFLVSVKLFAVNL
jgi:hypothetical protein